MSGQTGHNIWQHARLDSKIPESWMRLQAPAVPTEHSLDTQIRLPLIYLTCYFNMLYEGRLENVVGDRQPVDWWRNLMSSL